MNPLANASIPHLAGLKEIFVGFTEKNNSRVMRFVDSVAKTNATSDLCI
jgi:hypothetical protein